MPHAECTNKCTASPLLKALKIIECRQRPSIRMLRYMSPTRLRKWGSHKGSKYGTSHDHQQWSHHLCIPLNIVLVPRSPPNNWSASSNASTGKIVA